MMSDVYYYNKKVKNAGYCYTGHNNSGVIKIVFDDGIITIPTNSKYLMELLWEVFDLENIDNGVFIQEIEGKYFRLAEKNLEYIAIGHIVNDYFIELDKLTKAVE